MRANSLAVNEQYRGGAPKGRIVLMPLFGKKEEARSYRAGANGKSALPCCLPAVTTPSNEK